MGFGKLKAGSVGDLTSSVGGWRKVCGSISLCSSVHNLLIWAREFYRIVIASSGRLVLLAEVNWITGFLCLVMPASSLLNGRRTALQLVTKL